MAQSTNTTPKKLFLGCSLDEAQNDQILCHNLRLENVRLTAEFFKTFSNLSVNPAVAQIECPTGEQKVYQAPAKDAEKSVVFDINPGDFLIGIKQNNFTWIYIMK